MNNSLPEVSESEGVNPMEIVRINAQDRSVDYLIGLDERPVLPTFLLPAAPHYQYTAFIPGQQQIWMGIYAICHQAPNNCFLISYAQGVPSCGHSICSTCVGNMLAQGNHVCPFCLQHIDVCIPVVFR